jgi:cell division protein FtsI (penicillin-binding protein 3)
MSWLKLHHAPGKGQCAPIAPMRSEAQTGSRTAPAIETCRTRILMMVGLVIFAFTAICVRLVDLAMFQVAEEPVVTRVAYKANLSTQRGDIIDRNGVLLATNLATASLYAKPHKIMNGDHIANQLASVLPDLDVQSVAEELNGDSRFVWIRRNLTPRQQWQINRLGQPGLDFLHEEARVYPQGALSAHILGYADIDNNGLAGIEKAFDKVLRTSGNPVQVSLDMRVQHVMHDELNRAVTEFSATGAVGIVLNVRNGEVVALVSLPDFDPNHPADAAADQRFNRATLGVYEFGSTFKIFTTAIALETGVVDLSGGYDATQPIRISRFTIRDFHPQNRWLSVPEIFMYSSNIGAAKMALDFGGKTQRAYLGQLGLMESLPIGLVESGAPIVPRLWRSINTMTIGFGHGIAISALHLAAGAAATINGGLYNPPTFVLRSQSASETSPVGRRVFSEATSMQMRKLMRLVVEKGTGRKAAAPGYLVGGKTGTAETLSAGTYNSDALLSSFIGAFPINDPRYVVLVMLDNPKGNTKTRDFATGGWTAAPVVSRVVQRMAPFVAIAPIDEEAPKIRRELAIDISPKRPRLASY